VIEGSVLLSEKDDVIQTLKSSRVIKRCGDGFRGSHSDRAIRCRARARPAPSTKNVVCSRSLSERNVRPRRKAGSACAGAINSSRTAGNGSSSRCCNRQCVRSRGKSRAHRLRAGHINNATCSLGTGATPAGKRVTRSRRRSEGHTCA